MSRRFCGLRVAVGSERPVCADKAIFVPQLREQFTNVRSFGTQSLAPPIYTRDIGVANTSFEPANHSIGNYIVGARPATNRHATSRRMRRPIHKLVSCGKSAPPRQRHAEGFGHPCILVKKNGRYDSGLPYRGWMELWCSCQIHEIRSRLVERC